MARKRTAKRTSTGKPRARSLPKGVPARAKSPGLRTAVAPGNARSNAATLELARDAKSELAARLFPRHARSARSTASVSMAGSAGIAPGDRMSPAIPPYQNVVGLGFGVKESGGGIGAAESVRVYVRRKRNERDLTASEKVPAEISGIPTDVIPVGDVVAQAIGVRPVACGVSIGHFLITAGTLGCVVKPIGAAGPAFILSNNHVLANENQALPNDSILEPGRRDGGAAFPPIAKFSRAEPLSFGPLVGNWIDAAIAEIIKPADVDPRIFGIGAIDPRPLAATKLQSVRKTGRTTGPTFGSVIDLSADLWVSYLRGEAWFQDQIAIVGAGGNGFSAGGDSGSLIVDSQSNRPVALLFAGGTGVTFANPIADVLSTLGVEIVP